MKHFLNREAKTAASSCNNSASNIHNASDIKSGMNGSFVDMPSLNQKVPVKFISEYPKFLRPHKHFAYRRLNDRHVGDVMKTALTRYESELKKKEKERFDDACRFKN
jgi:hypothetical protein